MTSDRFSVLVDAIYSAAADPSMWPEVARKIQLAIGGHSFNLVMEDLSDSRVNCIYSNGVTQDQVQHYQQSIMEQDELTRLLEQVPVGSAISSQDFFDLNALHSLYCYEAFYEHIGYTHFNVGLFYRDQARRGWLSVVRSKSDRLFTPDECLLMQRLTPHLQRAFSINVQMLEAQMSSQLALDALEHIAAATMLLARNGRVLQHNSRAETYLHRSGPSAQDIRIRLPDASANQKLHTLILSLDKGRCGELETVMPFIENGVRKTVLCFPWRSSQVQMDWLEQTANCILFILSPTTEVPSTDLLLQTFGLSKAEAKVLQHLMGGQVVSETADVLFVSEAAVRFHIRNLLRKTHTRCQGELLSKVFNTVTIRIE